MNKIPVVDSEQRWNLLQKLIISVKEFGSPDDEPALTYVLNTMAALDGTSGEDPDATR